MSESQSSGAPAVEPGTEDSSGNVRELPAFKAVTSQLAEERKGREALEKQLAKLTEAEEKRKLEAQKKAGDFEAAEKTYLDKIAELEAKTVAAQQAIEERAKETELRVKLVASGVTSPKHQSFLLAEYTSLEDAPEIDDWIKTAAESDDYAPFFGGSKAGAPRAPMAASAAQDTKRKHVDLADPALKPHERKAAMLDQMRAFSAGHWKPQE